ncbi:hypothetical protein K4B79_29980 [Streptomyces lincolnensis]|uniref:hypothetical protein n=1 Tax=Streptomyces lincolnensis TaxID=1915 RepID=UPI001E549B5E|nr:hypothetical protein [Streptomyces lincolnensis]MCD7442433.1 hypothetical protein [Streptomyces lincolnensis]
MVSVTHTPHDIELTAESLQSELARLELQKQALERELAAVVAHLGSVQRALGALETALLRPATTVSEREPEPASASVEAGADPAPPRRGDLTEESDGHKRYGKLTEQIMEYFAEVGDVDVRARDVAAALGRDTDSGSINAVRSTLDRLVGTSRVRRAGRGLYRAAKPGTR